jgi:inhibitor of cysteine peptidase
VKIKILVAIALLPALLSVVACTAASTVMADKTGQDTKEVAIRTADEFDQTQHVQKQVEITKGNTLVVTLFSNATTGFSWDENAQIADTGIVQQLKHQYIIADSSSLGAPGTEQWTFTALKAGTTTIHLEYSRPWEGGEKGLWVFDLTVTVK